MNKDVYWKVIGVLTFLIGILLITPSSITGFAVSDVPGLDVSIFRTFVGVISLLMGLSILANN